MFCFFHNASLVILSSFTLCCCCRCFCSLQVWILLQVKVSIHCTVAKLFTWFVTILSLKQICVFLMLWKLLGFLYFFFCPQFEGVLKSNFLVCDMKFKALLMCDFYMDWCLLLSYWIMLFNEPSYYVVLKKNRKCMKFSWCG